MTCAVYVRVATREQLGNEQEQIQLIKKEKETQNRIVTTVFFGDGTQKDLSDDEIRRIFDGFLRGERVFTIEKPEKKFDYRGVIKLPEEKDGSKPISLL